MNATQQTRTVQNKLGLKFIILIASIVSFVTTTTGIYAIADIDSNEAYHKTAILLATIVFLIQFSIIYSLKYFEFRNLFNRNFLKTILIAILYVVLSMVSVTFGFTFWYELASAQDHAKRSMTLQVDNIDNRLLSAKSSLELVSDSIRNLSDYSAKKSNIEETRGSTCGYYSSPIYGTLTQIRMDDANITSEVMLDINKISNNLDQDIEAIRKRVSDYDSSMDINILQKDINNEIKVINNRYFSGNKFDSIIENLLSRSGKNRKSIEAFNKNKKKYLSKSCIDKQFTAKVNRVIERLNDLKPVKTISFFDAKDHRQLLNRTKNVLWASIGFKKIKNVDDMTDPNDVTTDDISALGIAIIIDFMILVLSIIDKTPAQQRRALSLAKVKDILDGKTDSSVYIKLQKFMAERFGSYLIAIPTDILDDSRIEGINYIVQYIKLKNMATLYANDVEASKLQPYFPKNLSLEYSNSSFRIYKMKKKQLEALLLEDISGELS